MSHLPPLNRNTNISFLHSLRGKLTLYFLGLALLPLIGVGSLAYWQSQQALYTQTTNQIAQLADIEADSVNTWLNNRLSEVKVMATSEQIHSLEPARVKEAVKLYAQEWPHFESVFVVGLDGMTIFRTDGDKPINLSERVYFQKALQGEPNVSDALVSKGTGSIIVVAAAPIVVNGQIAGVIGGTIPTTKLVELMSHARTGQTGEAYLINHEGYMITPSRFTDDLKAQGLIKERAELELQVNTLGAQEVLAGKRGVNEYPDYRGIPVLGAYTPIEQRGWGVLVEADSSEAFAAVTHLRNITLLIGLVTAVVVTGLGMLIARSMAAPMVVMTGALQNMARGDLNRDTPVAVKQAIMSRRDEMGVMGQALREAEVYFTAMAEAAGQIAQGDLAVEVKPYSDKDELGQAFARMIGGLRDLIGRVTANANQVGEAAQQLSAVAEQAGQATGQIAQTMNEVASGTQQQTYAVTKTAGSMDQMARAIDGVARGAQEQAQAIGQTAQAVSTLSGSIQAISGGVQAQTSAVARVKSVSQGLATLVEQISGQSTQVAQVAQVNLEAAQSGQQAAREAVTGMDRLGAATEQLAGRVRDLGKRSSQIGAIVETIDDIASQTNLLALNAAIEAARAGEYGKGFAVVADEVRKLAERSSGATKEIREMIQLVQTGAESTVEAMNQAGSEVQSGVTLTRQAGAAFETIAAGTADSAQQIQATLTAIKGIQAGAQQLDQALGGVEQVADQNRTLASEMERAAQAVGELVDQVSAVVEENTAATEQMAASSSEVSRAIEDISSVSEENSAAVEEVSASAEEMSAQVGEVATSAQSLNELAGDLQALVNNFKLRADDRLQDKIELCKKAHLRWTSRLQDLLAGKITLQPEEIDASTDCILGRWYYSRGQAKLGHLPEFVALEAPHRRLHETVRQAVTAYHQGKLHTVRAAIPEVEQLSHEVVGLLERLERHLGGTVTHEHARTAFELTPDSSPVSHASKVLAPQWLPQTYENRKVMTHGKTTRHF